jgi:hypothetical protein
MNTQEYLDTLARLNLKTASRETAMLLGLTVRQCQHLAAGHSRVTGTLERLLSMYRFHGTYSVRGQQDASVTPLEVHPSI